MEKEVAKVKLKEELRNELATKEDIALVRQEIKTVRQEIETVRQELKGEIKALEKELKGEIKALEWKMKFWIVIVIFLIIFTNKETIEFFLRLIGFLK